MGRKLLAVLFVAAAPLALVACSDDVKDAAEETEEQSDVVEGSSTTSTTTEDRETGKPLEIVDYGFTQLPPNSIGSSYVSYAVTVKNTTKKDVAGARLNIAFYNGANAVVKSQSESVSFVLPGQTIGVSSGSFEAQGVTRMEVKMLVNDDVQTLTADTIPTITAEGVTTTPEEFGGLQTNATLKSTFNRDLESLQVVAVYYDAANNIVGGDFTFADFVPANGTAAVEISTFQDVPVTTTIVYPMISNLTAAALGTDE